MTIKYAASYERKSTKDPQGIDAQYAINAKCAEGDGYTILDTPEFRFSDDDVSGRTTSRSGFDRLLEVVESGTARFDIVYVKDRTRLGRWKDYRLAAYYAVHLEKHGVRLRFTTEGLPLDFEKGDRGEILTRGITGTIGDIQAADELAQLTRRVTGGLRARLAQGFYPGSMAPYGTERWVASKSTGALIQPVPLCGTIRIQDGAFRLLRATDGTAEIVAEIFEMADQGISGRAIAKRLNERKIQSPSARRGGEGLWSGDGVQRVLANTTYAGFIIWGSKRADTPIPISEANLEETASAVVVEGVLVPPIVPRELFERVQTKLRGIREAIGRRRQGPDFLLSGLLQCAKCHQPLHGGNYSGGSGHRYYRHERRTPKLKACCVRRAMYPLEPLEKAVDEVVAGWLSSGDLAASVEADLNRLLLDAQADRPARDLMALQAREQDLEASAKKAALEVSRAKSASDAELFKSAFDQLSAELAQCREGMRLLGKAEHVAKRAQARFAAKKNTWLQPVDLYSAAGISDRRTFLQSVLKRVELDGDTGQMTFVLHTP